MKMTMLLMKTAMFRVDKSRHGFDQTVQMVRENALRVGWDIPWQFELQQHYQESGLSDMTKVVNLYLCDPQGGYTIMKDDAYKPMAVMMPTAVSVYETNTAEVYISRMNLGRMSAVFLGSVKAALRSGGERLENAFEGVIEA
jgi:uncharacterized protein (DUF302 family)